jgi:hypothetical protein
LYIQNISYTQTLSEIDHDDEYISQWSKGDDTFVLTRNLLSFPFLKLIKQQQQKMKRKQHTCI